MQAIIIQFSGQQYRNVGKINSCDNTLSPSRKIYSRIEENPGTDHTIVVFLFISLSQLVCYWIHAATGKTADPCVPSGIGNYGSEICVKTQNSFY
jgi:hypothetical protein